jgi:hypothetical protein
MTTEIPLATLVVTILIIITPLRAFPLCADGTGEGYVTASDALATLLIAVAGAYDPRLDVTTGAGTPPDDRVTATDALVVLGAAAANAVPTCKAADRSTAVITTASCDFATGGLAQLDLATTSIVEHRVGAVEPDAVVRVQNDRVFAINRFSGSSVQEVAQDGSLATLWRCSVGAGSNPHDVVLIDGDKAYVSRYDAVSISIVDPSVGPSCEDFVRGTIDLSAWADRDGVPEMDQMLRIGDLVYVALQRLDRDDFFRPGGPGVLVVIDASTDTVVDSIELAISNPFTETKGLTYDARSGRILIGGPGTLFSNLEDGGIEAVDPVTSSSLGVLLSGADLGGDLMDFAMLGTRRGFAVVADAGLVAAVVEFDLETGIIGAPLLSSSQNLSDIEVLEDGTLWVVDRNCFDPGLRAFRVSGGEITTEPIYPGLTPFTLDFVR